MRRFPSCPLLLAALITTTAASHAALVPLTNPGFETPALISGTLPGLSGWSGDTTVTARGADLAPPIAPTQGVQIAFCDSPAGNNFLMFQQTTEAIEANTVYNLQVDVYPLVDDASFSCLGIELVPTSFTGNFATRYWRTANFASEVPFGPFPSTDSITPIAGQWNRVLIGFTTADFPTQVSNGDRIQLQIRGHKFAIDNVLITKGANDFYVSSSTGNDNNDGLTPATAWQTFSNLSGRTIAPGSKVSLKRGDTWAGSELRLSGKGTALNPIRLTAYGEGANPVITGSNLTTASCVVIDNPSHWEIDSLDLRDAKVGLYLRYTGGNTNGTGAMFNNQNIVVSGCNFQNMDEVWSDGSGNITVVSPFELSWGSGIWVGGSIPAPPGGPWASESTTVLDGLTVRHSSFQDCSTGVGTNWYFPPKYAGRLKNVVIEDSWVTGCENGSSALFHVDGGAQRRFDTWRGGNGFYSTGTTAGFLETVRNFTIEDSEFAFNKRNNTGNDGVGFDFEGDTQDVTFQHNVLHNNDGAGILILPTSGNNTGLQMLSNTLWNNARNPKDTGQNIELTTSNNSHSGNFTNNGVYLGADTLTGLAVYNNTTRWNNLFAANTGNNRTGTAWSAVSGRPTSWTFASSVEGWGGENDWTGFAASGGALVGTSGADAFAESAATWVNTRERRWVLVTMSQTAGTTGQIFFQTETFPTYTPGKSVSFPIIADGTLRTYLVDMCQSAEYRGVVTRWRLDPTEAAGSAMVIDEFSARLDPFVRSVTAIDAQTIQVAFNQPMLYNAALFNTANYTLTGAGAGTLNANPTSVSQLITAGGPMFELKWAAGASNGSNATITVSGVSAARGHAIGIGGGAEFTTVAGSTVSDWWLLE